MPSRTPSLLVHPVTHSLTHTNPLTDRHILPHTATVNNHRIYNNNKHPMPTPEDKGYLSGYHKDKG